MDYYDEVIVASIDILGIRSILESNNGPKRAIDILSNIWVNATDANVYVKPGSFESGKPFFWESLKFGDSIYMFGNPKEKPEDQAGKIIARVAVLLVFGLYTFNTFLRCGIAKGDLAVKNVNIKNPPKHLQNYSEEIFIGTSMSRAHLLQERQKWIGGAVLGNVDCSRFTNLLINYNIPLKGKKIPKPYTPKYAINWINIAKENENKVGIKISDTIGKIDTIAKDIGNVDDKNVKEKIDNTKKFVNHVLESF